MRTPFSAVSSLLAPVLALSGLCAQGTVYTIDGAAADERLGAAVARAGDVDADGRQDFIVGAYGATPNGTLSGRAHVLSGATGAVIHTFDGDSTDDLFGSAVGAAGDVNGDGHDDVIVGAHRDDSNGTDSGSAFVFSGFDGSILYTFTGDSAGDLFGWSVDGAGDVNADGFDDLIVGAIFDDNTTTDAGNVKVFSGSDGSVLYTLDGTAFEQSFGWSVAGVGDLSNDGFEDFMVGTPFDDQNGPFSGSAVVYSGRDGAVIYTFLGDSSVDQFGHSVSGAGDVDRDGFRDVIVGAPGDDDNGTNSGSATVFSGGDGSALYTFLGDGIFDGFGVAVGGAGDLNGDGHADVLVGAPGDDNSGVNAGSARAFSGSDGSTLFTLDGGTGGDRLGSAVGVIGDIDDDGYHEAIVGSERASYNGSESGRVQVVELVLAGTPPRADLRGRGCPSSNGHIPRVRVIGRAAIGETFTVQLRGVVGLAPASLNIGVQWDLDLTPIGAPGCVAYAFPLLAFTAPVNVFGIANASLPVPNNPAFVGIRLHNAYAILDFAANNFGVVTSDDAVLTIGQ